VTEWEQFRALDLEEMASIMASSVIVDLRNVCSPEHPEWFPLLRNRSAKTACLLAAGYRAITMYGRQMPFTAIPAPI
jgi:hypothetical protein